jgi:hypothetical protein
MDFLSYEAFLAALDEALERPMYGLEGDVTLETLGFDSFDLVLTAACLSDLGVDLSGRVRAHLTLTALYDAYAAEVQDLATNEERVQS